MSHSSATIHLHADFSIGPVSPYIFGGFLEHMGRCVYEGVYEPGSAHADAHGFRADVLDALRELQMTIMRYPGGNFVSDYHWQDGVGDKSKRPVVKNLAWQSLESNQVGTDEFIDLCRMMNWEPMLAVNLGTGSPEEARNWVEYCNGDTPTRFAEQRIANGRATPHDVKFWCLGNEMDGPWQTGHLPADHYGIRARHAAQMMKGTDRSIQMVVCGSSLVEMPTYLEWDRTALEAVGSLASYVSLHRYVGNDDNDPLEYLATGCSIDTQIESVDAVCRYVQARRRSKRRAYLCFDEWNVWYKNRSNAEMNGAGKFAPHLIEEVYNLEDALVVAQFFNSFIRHADVLKVANIAQIVNVIAPLLTSGDNLLKQSIFYVFQLYSERKRGVSLRLGMDCPCYATKDVQAVTQIDGSAIWDEEGAQLTLFLVNRSPQKPIDIEVNLAGLGTPQRVQGVAMHHTDLKAANSFEDPYVVVPSDFDEVAITREKLKGQLPPASFVRLVVEID